MPVRPDNPFYVPRDSLDEVIREVSVRAAARQKLKRRSFNPELGSTADEADETLAKIRGSVDRYGEYVFGLTPARVHQFWNRAVDDVIQRRVRQNKILILAPPNSAKSTWNSLIRPCYHLGSHPDQNLLFMTSSDDMAKTFGSSVRMTLEESEKHREVFPDVGCRPHRTRGWSGDGLYLRGTPISSKDPAYKAVGFGMSVMGARANGIVLDDVLDQKQAESEIEQRKAINYYTKTVVPRLNTQNGWLLAVMTRFAEGDLGGHFIKLAEKSGDWLILRTPLEAEDDDPMGRVPGESLWPEQFPPEFIAQLKLSMSIAEYGLVYQADPTGIAGDIFTSEGYFKALPANFWQEIMPKCFTAQAVDLAFSKNLRTAFTVILTYAVDEHFNLYILHVDRARYSIKDSEERLKELIRWTRPLVTVVETESFHDATIRSMVIRIMSEIMCDVRLDKPAADKVTRARLPAGRAEHGFMYIDREAPWYRALMQELLGFPNTVYKDQVDALSLAALTVQRMEERGMRIKNTSTPQQARMVMRA
jgi:predicted phage terminase large subunit-like protein